MNIQLLSKPDPSIHPKIQVLLNRGIHPQDIQYYLSANINTINPPEAFGVDLLVRAEEMIERHYNNNDQILVVVDSDCDGFTSSAILINFLRKQYEGINLNYIFHEGKAHGLQEHMNYITRNNDKLIIVPDAGSGDYDQVEELKSLGREILILDHHPVDKLADTLVINNQHSNYPNKDFSGAGVVWQLCRFINPELAMKYIDLCSVGNMGDMMDIRNPETKAVIFEGLKEENIRNPLLYMNILKNEYSYTKADYNVSDKNGLQVRPISIAFFFVPLINAICRSGNLEEKKLVFEAMLEKEAIEMILSNKRGHKLGETERRVDQALRTLTNVKNRQTREEEKSLEVFDKKIRENNLDDHKIILITLKPGEVDKNVAGLISNKLANKYQRPATILTYGTNADGVECYSGSMRGYTKTGIESFKDICLKSDSTIGVYGHHNAAGLSVKAAEIDKFLADMDELLAGVSIEPTYYVDYILHQTPQDGDIILALAEMNDYLGTGIERPLVYLEDIKIDDNNIAVYKNNTLKIDINGIACMKF